MANNLNLKFTPMNINRKLDEYKDGFKKGIPVCLGYISVSITFGILATNGGLDIKTSVFISATNLTSAGQFAGLELIFNTAPYIELALTMLVINIRYMLMSLSLSQKLSKEISFLNRLLISFGITDEIFSIASLEKNWKERQSKWQ